MTNKPKKKKRRKGPKELEKLELEKLEQDAVIEAVGGDADLAAFFLAWLKFGRNSTKAYTHLHPNVKKESAHVLGCRMLSKVNVPAILESYGIGIHEYIAQLKDGLSAKKKIIIGMGEESTIDYVPDHKTRRHYHKALGEMLKLEGVVPVVQVNNQNNNIQKNSIESLPDDEMDELLER